MCLLDCTVSMLHLHSKEPSKHLLWQCILKLLAAEHLPCLLHHLGLIQDIPSLSKAFILH